MQAMTTGMAKPAGRKRFFLFGRRGVSRLRRKPVWRPAGLFAALPGVGELVTVLDEGRTGRQHPGHRGQQRPGVGLVRRHDIQATQCHESASVSAGGRAQKKRLGICWPIPGRKAWASACQVKSWAS